MKRLRDEFGRWVFRPSSILLALSIIALPVAALGQSQIEKLIQKLKNDDETSQKAYWDLVEMGASAMEPLIKALKDKNAVIRLNAAMLLGDIRDARAVEPLIAVLKDEKKDVRNNAEWALAKIKK